MGCYAYIIKIAVLICFNATGRAQFLEISDEFLVYVVWEN